MSDNAVELSVVIWSKTDKRIESYPVSMNSTFQEVIDEFTTAETCFQRALVGHQSRPFKLMSCDFAGEQPCLGDKFETRVFDTVFWMNYDGVVAKAAAELQWCRENAPLSEVLKGYSIHLFTYNHQEDCCDGVYGPWTERDPAKTNENSTLWLRLEKEFIQNGRKRKRDNDWTLATLEEMGIGAPVAAPDGLKAMLCRLHKYTLPGS